MPVILHWNQNHFVVCYNISKKKKWFKNEQSDEYKFDISDPNGRKYSITQDGFLKCWTSTKLERKGAGIVLVLSPIPNFYTQEEE